MSFKHRPGRFIRGGFAAAAAVFCAVLAVVCLKCSGQRSGRPGTDAERLPPAPIRLANRVVGPSGSGADDPPAALSPRGTAAYAVACAVPVTKALREKAAALGARVIAFLPERALLVEATPDAAKKMAGDPAFDAAVAYTPTDKVRSGVNGGRVTVVPLSEEDRPALVEFIRSNGGSAETAGPSLRGSFAADVAPGLLAQLASRGDVRWIERRCEPMALNEYAAADTGVAECRELHGLTGRGQVVATADTGIDTGDIDNLHPDFEDRVKAIINSGGITKADKTGHGTHTAGILAGSGNKSGGLHKGVAYEAELVVQTCGDGTASGAIIFDVGSYDEVFAAGMKYGAYIQSDSWGGNTNGEYDELCEGLDYVTWNNPELLVVLAAGNGGSKAGAVTSPALAKNSLSVANSYSSRSRNHSIDEIYSGSSRGPCADGRLKPEIAAPGTEIVSTRSSRCGKSKFDAEGYYLKDTGTSMATPHVAGCAALVRQWLVENGGYSEADGERPTGALMRAILTGGAHDMGKNINAQGFGRVDLEETLFPSNRNIKTFDRMQYRNGSLSAWSFSVTNETPFDVQLAWTDHPADPSAARAIVNDLDLVVMNADTGEFWYGNGVDGGDRINTVESVRIASAARGEYIVAVMGSTVPYDSTEGGSAALYVRGAFSDADGYNTDADTRRITVSVSGPDALCHDGIIPGPGYKSVLAGSRIVLSAPCFATTTNRYGTAVSRHVLQGRPEVKYVDIESYMNDGTNATITIVATNKAAVAWEYADEPESYALRMYAYAGGFGTYEGYDLRWRCDGYEPSNWHTVWDKWVEPGTEVELEIPGGLELGESFSINTLYFGNGWDAWEVNTNTTVRLGAVEITNTDEENGVLAVDGRGVMADSTSFSVTNGTDVTAYYWDEHLTVGGTSIPYWWYMRNLYYSDDDSEAYSRDDGDPDEDGFGNLAEYQEGFCPVDESDFPFRIVSFSPTNMVWIGGAKSEFTVQHAQVPSSGEDAWSEAQTSGFERNGVTNTVALPVPQSHPSRAFYRVKLSATESRGQK